MPNVSSDNNKRESIMPTSGNETAVVHETGAGRLQLEAEAGGSVFIVDEPVSAGGLDPDRTLTTCSPRHLRHVRR